MKSTTLIYYGSDTTAAKEAAAKTRESGGRAQVRHVLAFDGRAEEICDRALALPCVSEFDFGRLRKAYDDLAVRAGLASPLPPPPPPPPLPSPLARLGDNWRSKPVAELKQIAAAISGRAVDNKDQAVQIIADALAAQK